MITCDNHIPLSARQTARSIKHNERIKRQRRKPETRERNRIYKQKWYARHPGYHAHYMRWYNWWTKWGYIPLPHIQFSEFDHPGGVS